MYACDCLCTCERAVVSVCMSVSACICIMPVLVHVYIRPCVRACVRQLGSLPRFDPPSLIPLERKQALSIKWMPQREAPPPSPSPPLPLLHTWAHQASLTQITLLSAPSLLPSIRDGNKGISALLTFCLFCIKMKAGNTVKYKNLDGRLKNISQCRK